MLRVSRSLSLVTRLPLLGYYEGAHASTFLCGSEIILEELIHKLLLDRHLPLLLLQVNLLWAPLILTLSDKIFYRLWMETVHDLPKEVTLWQPLLFAMWIR